MVINYLILAHTNFEQLDRLIAALDSDFTYFYVHIDKRVDLNTIKECKFFHNKRVKLVRRRLKVSWGGFNMVNATLNLMALASKNREKAYFVLLSGQDFPLKPIIHIHDFLSANYGAQYVDHVKLPYIKWANGGFDRLDYYWFIDQIGYYESSKLVQSQKEQGGKRPYFDDFPAYGGSQWWCLTNEGVDYVLKFIRHNPIIMEFFSLTFIPDELFFQTILLNSPFADSIVNNHLRHIVFVGDFDNPVIFREEDFYELSSSPALWARKFDQHLDNTIIQKLERHLALAESPA